MSITSQLESLCLVAAKPLSFKEAAVLLAVKEKEIEVAVSELTEKYKSQGSGFSVVVQSGKFQLTSASENADLIQRFLQSETTGELSQPSLEALTIIAYRGPVGKFELERIRGVNCSLIIRNLLLRGLIEEKFDRSVNENKYSITLDFLKFLGISQVTELPDYEKLRNHPNLAEFLAAAEKES